jgi:hypothetical protein
MSDRLPEGARIDLRRYVNAANISGADVPHVVVEKLQRAIDAAPSATSPPNLKALKTLAAQEWDRWKENGLPLYDGAPEMTRLRMAYEAGYLQAVPSEKQRAWSCGWSPQSHRCLRLECRNSVPCDGYYMK